MARTDQREREIFFFSRCQYLLSRYRTVPAKRSETIPFEEIKESESVVFP